ncbi:cytochrome P450 6a2-like isoform X1 [Bemisia tabaci]|uniref:cytochrome P450 6a2-like isoform X1 n=1 Tax=Bemisia tabaci TaxID=7038 RepID=UPI003B288EFA
METFTVILLILMSIFIYGQYRFHKKHKYWAKLGVPCVSKWRLFVQTVAISLGRLPLWTMFTQQYDALSGHKWGGTYQIGRPSLFFRDPEIIRCCLVNSFSHFHDRHDVKTNEDDPLTQDLFHLCGHRWHIVRQRVAQAFSSAKLRLLYQSLCGCAQKLDAHISSLCSEQGSEEVEVCIKELMANYTMEVISASALGIQCNAIKYPDCELRRILELTMSFSFRKYCIWFMECIWPGLYGKLGISHVSCEILQFYRSIIKDAEEMKRKDAEPHRKDFLQILMNLRDSEQQSERKTEKNDVRRPSYSNSRSSPDGEYHGGHHQLFSFCRL